MKHTGMPSLLRQLRMVCNSQSLFQLLLGATHAAAGSLHLCKRKPVPQQAMLHRLVAVFNRRYNMFGQHLATFIRKSY